VKKPTVLVPLDGSPLAEASLYYLPALRRLGQFEVEMIHVEEPEGEAPPEAPWGVEPYLEEKASALREATGLEVRVAHPRGTPYALVLAEAEDPRVAMVLTTTQGRGGLERWRTGSVADKVIRGAPCPVMVVGPSSRGAPAAFERILVPLDGSRLAEEALPVAKLVAERLGSTLRLVRAVTPRTVPDELAGTITADVIESYELVAEEYLQEARLELETRRPVETRVVLGPAAEVIVAEVREAPCDLVVMTSHGRHGFVRFAMGSVTERVLAASAAPVLVLKPQHWERFRLFEAA
jgi:nucleotide-binding universal stress UspA family protein